MASCGQQPQQQGAEICALPDQRKKPHSTGSTYPQTRPVASNPVALPTGWGTSHITNRCVLVNCEGLLDAAAGQQIASPVKGRDHPCRQSPLRRNGIHRRSTIRPGPSRSATPFNWQREQGTRRGARDKGNRGTPGCRVEAGARRCTGLPDGRAAAGRTCGHRPGRCGRLTGRQRGGTALREPRRRPRADVGREVHRTARRREAPHH